MEGKFYLSPIVMLIDEGFLGDVIVEGSYGSVDVSMKDTENVTSMGTEIVRHRRGKIARRSSLLEPLSFLRSETAETA